MASEMSNKEHLRSSEICQKLPLKMKNLWDPKDSPSWMYVQYWIVRYITKMKLLLSELLQPTLHNLWTCQGITKQIHFECYQELQRQSLACIVLTCCLQKRENDQQISACIQPEEWSSHSEVVSSVGCWMSHNDYKGYPINMILHQHAEGVLLMVADPFPNKDPSEFTVKIVEGPVFLPPTCGSLAGNSSSTSPEACKRRQFPWWWLNGSSRDPYIFNGLFVIPIKLGSIIIEILMKL